MEIFTDEPPSYLRTSGTLLQAVFALRNRENVLLIVSNQVERQRSMEWVMTEFGKHGFPCSFQHNFESIRTEWGNKFLILLIEEVARGEPKMRGVDWHHYLVDHHAMKEITARWLGNFI